MHHQTPFNSKPLVFRTKDLQESLKSGKRCCRTCKQTKEYNFSGMNGLQRMYKDELGKTWAGEQCGTCKIHHDISRKNKLKDRWA